MRELNNYKLSDLYVMSSGISTTPEQAGHGSSFVSFSSVFGTHFLPEVLPDKMNVSEREQKTYSVEKGDVFLTRTSETLDELGMSSVAHKDYPNATFSGFLKRLRPIEESKVSHKFMAFYLRSKLFRKTMDNNAVMTLRCSLNEQIFSYLDVLIPEIDEQTKIGDLLFLIYSKIELNNRINAELEGMAKLLYDYWFVQFDFPMSAELAAAVGRPDLEGKPYKTSGGKMVFDPVLKREIPVGWGIGTLSDIAKITMGQSPPGVSYNFTGEGTLFFQGSTDFGWRFPTARQYTTQPTRFAKEGDILLSVRAPVGTMNIAPKDCSIGRGISSLRSKSNHDTYLFSVMTYFKQIFDRRNSDGTTFGSINKDDLHTLKVVIPNPDTVERFEEKVRPGNTMIANNQKQNQELAELRDWLLPMLMNGQVTVGDTKDIPQELEL